MKKIIFTLLLLFLIFELRADTYLVANTNDSGIGSLRICIDSAQTGDTVRFDPLLIAAGSKTIVLSTPLLCKNITIKGLYNSTDTLFISGNKLVQILTFNNGSLVTLDSLILIDAYVVGDGGAISIRNSVQVNLYNSIIRNCEAIGKGGGIYCYTTDDIWTYSRSTKINIVNSSITGNGKAGIYSDCAYNSEVNITSSIISNHTENGVYALSRNGANPSHYSTINVLNSTINDNGIGLFSDAPGPTFSNSKVSVRGSFVNNNGQIGIISDCSNNLSEIFIDGSQLNENGKSPFSSIHRGGLLATSGSGRTKVKIYNSSVSRNEAHNGTNASAILCYELLELKIYNSLISNNLNALSVIYAETYSGITAPIAVASFINSSISDNQSNGSIINLRSINTVEILSSTISNNVALNSSGFSYSCGNRDCKLKLLNSTFSNNYCDYLPPIPLHVTNTFHFQADNPSDSSVLSVKNCTFYNNNGKNDRHSTIVVKQDNGSSNHVSTIKNSIVTGGIFTGITGFIGFKNSLGYNIFSDTGIYSSLTSDQFGIDSVALKLDTLAYNGGNRKTHLPLPGSPALNMGNPSDFTDAQNGPISDSRRDVGACENGAGPFVSVKEAISNPLEIKVYPNPNNGSFTLNLNNPALKSRVLITDIRGKLVKTLVLNSELNHPINFEGVPGIYFVNVVTSSERAIYKIIKY